MGLQMHNLIQPGFSEGEVTMRELTADLFISLDGFASGVNEAAFFGYFGEELGRDYGTKAAGWRSTSLDRQRESRKEHDAAWTSRPPPALDLSFDPWQRRKGTDLYRLSTDGSSNSSIPKSLTRGSFCSNTGLRAAKRVSPFSVAANVMSQQGRHVQAQGEARILD
jgi:hypothetical protein